jgi:hypothetical protein
MQLVINVKNKDLANEILNFLKSFENKGVKILRYEEREDNFDDKEWDEGFIRKHWREIGMNTHSADRDDDEYLYEAASEFYNEKYSD